jgi:hypothetical protein
VGVACDVIGRGFCAVAGFVHAVGHAHSVDGLCVESLHCYGHLLLGNKGQGPVLSQLSDRGQGSVLSQLIGGTDAYCLN